MPKIYFMDCSLNVNPMIDVFLQHNMKQMSDVFLCWYILLQVSIQHMKNAPFVFIVYPTNACGLNPSFLEKYEFYQTEWLKTRN